MNKPYLYAVLFGVPGFFLALAVSLAVVGVAAGALWLFVFGDSPWPAAAGSSLGTLAVLVFVLVWGGAIVAGYRAGRKLAPDGTLNRRHVLLSSGLTIAALLVLVLHQWGVGNIGTKPDTLRCSEYCRQSGYPGSGMPPRDSGDTTCRCYDEAGREMLKVPLERLN
jgi:hypothetical protein